MNCKKKTDMNRLKKTLGENSSNLFRGHLPNNPRMLQKVFGPKFFGACSCLTCNMHFIAILAGAFFRKFIQAAEHFFARQVDAFPGGSWRMSADSHCHC